MKVFLSWSGVRSHKVAQAFADWLPTVLTASKPWISSEDIDKGATWITGIKEALAESKGVGVFFATRDALSSPWLNFEAGAIASLGAQRVCVVCVDIEPGEMNPPLSLFQSTKIEREDMFRLLKTLNGQLTEPSSDPVLAKIFERSWADLDESIRQAMADTEKAGKKGRRPTTDQVIADIATGVQRIESRLSTLEAASQRTVIRPGEPYEQAFRRYLALAKDSGTRHRLNAIEAAALVEPKLNEDQLRRLERLAAKMAASRGANSGNELSDDSGELPLE